MRSNRFNQIALISLAFLLASCTSGFEELKERGRSTNAAEIPVVGEGLPFYTKTLLNPTWDVGDTSKLAKIERLQMTDQSGAVRGPELFFGRPTFVAFFFASCGGFCPMIIQNLKRIEREVSKTTQNAQFVAVTVNPEVDTPEYLAAYTRKNIDPSMRDRWVFLTGKYEQIRYLADEVFSIEAFKKISKNRIVHSERIFLIDSNGFLRKVLNGTRKDTPENASLALKKLSLSGGIQASAGAR